VREASSFRPPFGDDLRRARAATGELEREYGRPVRNMRRVEQFEDHRECNGRDTQHDQCALAGHCDFSRLCSATSRTVFGSQAGWPSSGGSGGSRTVIAADPDTIRARNDQKCPVVPGGVFLAVPGASQGRFWPQVGPRQSPQAPKPQSGRDSTEKEASFAAHGKEGVRGSSPRVGFARAAPRRFGIRES
jgi:hypothetical protein